MLMNRIVCLLSSTLLFTFPTGSNISPFLPTEQSIEKQIDLNGMVQDIRLKNFMEQVEKDKIELEKKKNEEEAKRQKQLEEQKKNEPQWQTFVLTYYGLLSSECGNTKGITASGKRISRGMIASPPQLKFGTKIMIEGNEYVVEDRGSSKYIKVNNDGSIRLDVYLPKIDGESDNEYYKRIQSKGVRKVKGYIIKQ